MTSFINIIATVSAVCLAFTYLITSFSLILRIIGAINNFNSRSWNLANAIILINSLLIAIFLTSIAFIIDYQPTLKLIFIIFAISTSLISLGHLFYLYRFQYVCLIIEKIIYWYFKKNIKELNFVFNKKNFIFDKFAFSAWICLLLGFMFPSILAVIFNEYRTSLFQLSFIFNSIGTFITVLITDKQATLLSDKSNMTEVEKNKLIDYLYNILLTRLISSLIVNFSVFVLLYFYLTN